MILDEVSSEPPVAGGEHRRVTIVIPVYNDWQSFFALVPLLDEALAPLSLRVEIVAVDDGSEPCRLVDAARRLRLSRIAQISTLRLVCNVGHQRAIAIGLADVVRRRACDIVLVMDGDGEDRPDDVRRLLESVLADTRPGFTVGQRRKRSESFRFKVSYNAYKVCFRILTGTTIDFGNFSAAGMATMTKLVYSPHCWNHYAAAVLRTGMPIRRVGTDRGRRLMGRSSMNFTSLILLGLSAMSVYGEVVFVRVLVAALACSAAALVAFIGIVGVRLLSALAIPGWTSILGAIFIVLLFQALAVSAGAAFQILGDRSRPLVVPALEAQHFILDREHIFSGPERRP